MTVPYAGRANQRATQTLVVVAVVCLALQTASAGLLDRDLQTPNASTRIAESLAADGTFAVHSWHRLRGREGPIPDEPLRAFHLPGEPVFLALGFALVPEPLWRYLHVPVTVVFVTSVAAVGFALGGARIGMAAGLAAALDPFVLFHGPVWDDTFLAAAAEWAILAGILAALGPRSAAHGEASSRWGVLLLVFLAAAFAAATRLQSQVLLGCLVAAACSLKFMRQARPLGWAMAAGMAVSIGLWTARNALVFGALFMGSSHDGLTLFESTYAHARAAIVQTGTIEGLSQTHLDEQFAHAASLGELDADTYYRRTAWHYIRSNPLDVAWTAGLKLAVSLTGADLSTSLLSLRNTVTVVTRVALLLVGSWGLVLAWPRSRIADEPHMHALFLMFGLTVVLTMAMLALGPNGLRYWMSAAGFLYVGVGVVIARYASASRTRLTGA